MRLAPLCIFLLMMALTYSEARARSPGRKQFRNIKMRRTGSEAAAAKVKNVKRKLLIQCCGRASCAKIALKKKPSNTNKMKMNSTDRYSRTTKQTLDDQKSKVNHTTEDDLDEEGDPESVQEVQVSGPAEGQTSAVDDSSTPGGSADEPAKIQSTNGNANVDSLPNSSNAEEKFQKSTFASNVEISTFSSQSTEKSIMSPSISSSALAIIPTDNSFATNSGGTKISTLEMVNSQSSINGVENTSTATKTTEGKSTTLPATSTGKMPPDPFLPASQTTAENESKTYTANANTTSSITNEIITSSTANSLVTSEKTTESSTLSVTFTSTSTSTTTTATTERTKGYTTATTKAPKVLPSCPISCVKDKTEFRFDGTLDEPTSHGFWESGCGELYVFGKSLANWEQNMQKCCSIGMTPLTIDSKEKSTCFNKLINGIKWKYNSRYWTSGLRSSAIDFKWCNSSAPVDSALWLANEPNNVNDTENCAQLVISKTNSSARLEDLHCGRITAFACQGPTTPKPPCESPACPNATCEKNKSFYTVLADKKTSYLTSPSNHGYFISFDNRSFVFSFQNDTRTFQESYTACCSIGMKLLSLHQPHKYKSTMGALKSGKLQADEFWTSGTDLGCEGNFGYCSSTRLLREEAQWDMAQPDNINGSEHCLSVNLQYNTALLRDERCEDKKRYICEARQASGAKVIESECGSAFNLTSEQIKKLMVTMPTLLEEKCFLKCFGEGTDMFVNGRLMDEKIFAQFTSVSAGDMGKLMDMYATMNFCASGTRGMDSCDKASQLLKCGKENSPELLQGVMNNLENMIKEAPLVLPPTAGVCPEFTCVIDDALKTMFENAAHQSMIGDAVFTGRVTHSCNKKYLFAHYPAGASLEVGLEFCCKFGLRLLTVVTLAQLQCLQQFEPYGTWGANQYFIVAATRMGNVPNPKWCFSDTPFFPTVASDYLTSNPDPNSLLIIVSFSPGGAGIAPTTTPYAYIACESIN